ncbi:phosphatidate cytidylyltransferase [Hymenobacter sp. BT523]|uniref:phosphatidate cytidylyltransferase n=1 Tax=Hymenobacter sp. BT523 TaxID=2795725 RepID=UPI001E44D9C8|nr:phosphatidate cytidylyltransferase [Hymenobacter sp. BT523]
MRVIWGVIGAALLLGSVWFSPWTFGLFFAAVQAVMLWEFYRMMRAGGYAPATWIGVGAGLLIFWCFWRVVAAFGYQGLLDRWDDTLFPTILILMVLPVVLVLLEVYKWSGISSVKSPFADIGITLAGLIYVSLPMSLLTVIALGGRYYDYRRIFALLFLIWASDIGAYAAGKTFGKHKMAPSISPGKTWEGWAGGFAMTLIVGWTIGYMLPDMLLTYRLVAAGVVAVFAPLGDLAESMLKRSVGVKDSGSIMPGHGGLLDRFDAFLLVLPVLALLQLLAG